MTTAHLSSKEVKELKALFELVAASTAAAFDAMKQEGVASTAFRSADLVAVQAVESLAEQVTCILKA